MDEGCRVGEFAHLEGEDAHLAGGAFDLSRDGEGDGGADLRGACRIFSRARLGEGSSRHGKGDLVVGNARGTDGDGVVKAGVEHVHEVGCHGGSGGRGDDIVLLCEVAADDVAGGVRHEDVAGERILSGRVDGEVVVAVGCDAASVDVDFGSLGRVNRCHEDVGAEGFSGIERGGFRADVGVELVDADVFHVNVGKEAVNHLVLRFPHVALEFGEHGAGSDGGHLLEHVLLPVLAQIVLSRRHVGVEVGGDDGLSARVGDEVEDAVAEGVDGVEEVFALSFARCEHDFLRGVEVFLVLEVVGVAVGTVGFSCDGLAEVFGEIVERVTHLLHLHGFFIPRCNLVVVRLELRSEVFVKFLVFFHGVSRGEAETVSHELKTLQHVA